MRRLTYAEAREVARRVLLQAEAERSALALREVQAYGETVAPEQVDTLRDEECPICGSDSDAFDGDQCRECGFILPPSFARDPDLEMARKLDLREEPKVPEISPEEAGPGGPMPGTVGPNQIGPDGEVPEPPPGQAVTMTDDAVTPDQLDEEGEVAEEGVDAPDVDPAAAEQHVDQGGETFTEGPDDPEGPSEPEGPETEAPVDPDDLDEEGELTSDQAEEVPGAGVGVEDDSARVEGDVEQLGDDEVDPEAAEPEEGVQEAAEGTELPEDAEVPEEGAGDAGVEGAPDGEAPEGQAPPGTPGDSVPDLICPACGLEAPAAQPTTVSMDDPAAPTADGLLAGDACPNCGKATLLPIADFEEMEAEVPEEEGAPEDDAGAAPEDEGQAPEEGTEEPDEEDEGDEEDDDEEKAPPKKE